MIYYYEALIWFFRFFAISHLYLLLIYIQFNDILTIQNVLSMSSNSGRISFAGLKNERNKENDICFQNLKFIPSHKSIAQNSQHQSCSIKNFAMPQHKLKQNENGDLCTSARFANAIKQIGRTKANTKKNKYDLEQAFQRAQHSIRIQIDQYQSKYTEISEMLADLHIKDLMKFNESIERNQMLYQQAHIEDDYSIVNIPKFLQANQQDLKRINEIERVLQQIISDKNKSFDFRSTYESRHKKTISGHSSRVSPQLGLETSSPLKIVKKNSTSFGEIVNSIKSNLIKNSRSSKVDSFGQQKRLSQALQDTPESVKSKISCTTKIRVQKNAEIGMFDRINVCQSIQHYQPIESFADQQQNTGCRVKRDHRYGRSSQQ